MWSLHQISNFTASSWRIVICVSYQSNNSILNMLLMKGTGFIKIILAKINGIPCSPSHKAEQYGKIFDCIFKIPRLLSFLAKSYSFTDNKFIEKLCPFSILFGHAKYTCSSLSTWQNDNIILNNGLVIIFTLSTLCVLCYKIKVTRN